MEVARICACGLQQVLDVAEFCGRAGIHDQGSTRHTADGNEVCNRVVGNFLQHQAVQNMGRAVAEQNGVTVRRRVSDSLNADDGLGPRFVLDDGRHTGRFADSPRVRPCDQVVAAASAEGHDDSQRPGFIRECLRNCCGADGAQRHGDDLFDFHMSFL